MRCEFAARNLSGSTVSNMMRSKCFSVLSRTMAGRGMRPSRRTGAFHDWRVMVSIVAKAFLSLDRVSVSVLIVLTDLSQGTVSRGLFRSGPLTLATESRKGSSTVRQLSCDVGCSSLRDRDSSHRKRGRIPPFKLLNPEMNRP